MKFTHHEEAGILFLRLEGQLMGGPDAEEVRELFLASIEKGTTQILLDMEEVSWVNSSGLGILIAGHLAARQKGGALKMIKVSQRIESILNVTRLSSIFEVFESESDARHSFETTPAGPHS